MDTETLEQLLDGAEETDTLEFKAAIEWSKNTFVKDILAMTNVIDGGRIIVGVEDETFERQGLTDEQIATFNIEIMKDQIAPYADPLVVFRCEIASDRAGRRYAVIEVSPFERIPVVCRRDGADVKAGTVYFRSRARRPQSARVQTSSEMQEIIETAVVRTMRRMRRMGFEVEEPEGYDYDEELGDLQ